MPVDDKWPLVVQPMFNAQRRQRSNTVKHLTANAMIKGARGPPPDDIGKAVRLGLDVRLGHPPLHLRHEHAVDDPHPRQQVHQQQPALVRRQLRHRHRAATVAV